MIEMLQNFINSLHDILAGLGWIGILAACALMFFESIVPFMPISVFITVIFYTFGSWQGLIICYIFTCLGCMASYELCRRVFKKFIEKKIIPRLGEKKRAVLENFMKKTNKMTVSSLTILLTIPFTPCSPVNVAAGITDVDRKKFYLAVVISKIFMVYFWGYIGTSLLESINNPYIIVKVVIILIISWILSKILNKVFKFD